MKDLYNILGISKDSFSEKELQKQYRKLAKEYHPDRQAGKSEQEKKNAEEKFKEISHAYEVLSDPEKKRNYDMFGDENGNMSGGGFNPFGDGNPFNPFEDVMNMFGHRSSGFRSSVMPGRDIQMRIPITIKDLFNGVEKTVKFTKQVRCVNCHGSGGSGQKTCPTCHGAGKIIKHESHGAGWSRIEETICPTCGGTGFTIEHKCPTCNGTGFMTKESKLTIKIPAGVNNNVGIVYKGEGSESKSRNGENGNFIAITEYNIDENKYIIQGLNVIENIEIPYYDLLLGCSYTVNIPNGVKKKIKIDPCPKEGDLIKLSKQGIKVNNYQVGDYYVCIHYKFPDKLTNDEKQCLEKIKVLNKI